jgi:putative DNA primase/helicase
VILHPVVGLMGDHSSVRGQEVRTFLQPLKVVCARHNAALLCVGHLNRGDASSVQKRVGASKAFREVARSAMVFGRERDTDRRVLSLDKSNLVNETQSLVFEVEVVDVDFPDATFPVPRLNFVEYGDHPADSLLDSGGAKKLKEAVALLKDILKSGPIPSSEVFAEADDRGITRSTLNRAKTQIGIKPEKSGFDAGWTWALPAAAPTKVAPQTPGF